MKGESFLRSFSDRPTEGGSESQGASRKDSRPLFKPTCDWEASDAAPSICEESLVATPGSEVNDQEQQKEQEREKTQAGSYSV